MATVRSAHTVWNGDLFNGQGEVTLDSSGLGTYDVTWKARAEEANGKTSPEELIAAAHSACFSMAFSNGLAEAGKTAERIETSADVSFVPGTGITESRLKVTAVVPGLTAEEFQDIAEAAKSGCPVSQALAGIKISLEATLES
ncbi:OsmC family protein [Arthrobacter sp. zg-Y820]|uniref:OsmC family protein n=1 Tax=unclassified Arthrobacter TaxID=235627 RepID=UPI001E545F44|nr:MULTISPECIES: OsmC family protein [unclassified Arthrobacter]MCC9197824.1 OsmC family protein [Arthrobacter sp. zg-Y820]MDK1280691.1 OsmC family protein [Arthrobacter sp. zg.Y820]MDK1360966.1 OsmC family protein [Arthrobacter sp. zg-Y1219]WIB10676.1 OsmC family protein [Arthrobacter sp. zg-Y820]